MMKNFAIGRRPIPRKLILGCLLPGLLVAGSALRAQRPAPRERTTPAPPVQVTVVVRNLKGRTISFLRRRDFRLYDNGRYQHITDFASNLVPVVVHQPKAPWTIRYTALFFDDLHFTFTDTIRVTDSAYDVFGPRLSREHRFGVFTASGEVTLGFTGNRKKFHQALLAIHPHLPSPAMAKACPALTDYEAYLLLYVHDPLALKVALYDLQHCPGRHDASDPVSRRARFSQMRRLKAVVDRQAARVIEDDAARSNRTVASLAELISKVSALPDPRSIIVASPGFLTGTLGRRVDELARLATRHHIIVNTLDTTGLVHQIPNPQGPGSSEAAAIIDAKNEMLADRAGATSDPLADLATMTGGNFITNMDDLDTGFEMAAPLPAAYYVLGYHPNNLRRNGRFHSVRVTLYRRRGLSVAAPAGYFAPGTPAEIAASSLRDRHQRRRRRRRK